MRNSHSPSQSPSVTALPKGEPRGRTDLRLRGACGRQSLSPFGAAPFTQGSLFSAETPNCQPNSKRRLSAQARGSLQLPRNARPVPSKDKGEMPKRGTPLGCSLVLSRSEKEQSPYPHCSNRAANRNLQSCHDATQPTPPKLLPLSPRGTPLPYEGKLKTPKRYRKTYGCEPSQSPAVTALPEGEPRGLRGCGGV